MTTMRSAPRQRGRLMEIPILIALAGIGLAVLVPALSSGKGWLASLLQAALVVGGVVGAFVALALVATLPGMLKDWWVTPRAVRAARSRDPLAALQRIPAERLDARATGPDGLTALHAACDAWEPERVRQAAEVIAFLVERGADPNAKNALGDPPLKLAIRRDLGLDAVARLLAAGASPDGLVHEAAGRDHAGAIAVLEALLGAGARVDERDVLGGAPLHAAAKYGSPAMVQALLSRGAEVDAIDRDGDTPLHAVLWLPSLTPERTARVAAALVAAGADPDRANRAGKTPRALAEASGIPAIVDAMKRPPASVPDAG